MSVQLQRLIDRKDPRIESFTDETDGLRVRPGQDPAEVHDGYWLDLAPGWINQGSETHSVHEWTVKACLETLKYDVRRCYCDQCVDDEKRLTADFHLDKLYEGTDTSSLVKLVAKNFKARNWIVKNLKILADPHLDDIGLEIALTILRGTGYTIYDNR